MSPLDHQLNRLLRSAAHAPAVPVGEVDLAIQSQALAAWRRVGASVESVNLLTVLRRGLVLAGAVAAITVFFSLQQDSQTTADETAIVDDVYLVALSR
jgi:hypothetical protein